MSEEIPDSGYTEEEFQKYFIVNMLKNMDRLKSLRCLFPHGTKIRECEGFWVGRPEDTTFEDVLHWK